MDGQQFDAVSCVLGTRMSRGRVLALLAGVAALRWGVASAAQRATLYLTDDTCRTGPTPTPDTRGYVDYRRGKDNVTVTISLKNAEANAAYDVFQGCVGLLGTIRTNKKRAGKGTFTYAFDAGNAHFGVDMYRPGDDYQYIGSGRVDLQSGQSEAHQCRHERRVSRPALRRGQVKEGFRDRNPFFADNWSLPPGIVDLPAAARAQLKHAPHCSDPLEKPMTSNDTQW